MDETQRIVRDIIAAGIYNRNKGILRQGLVPSNAAPGSMGSPMGTMGNPMMMTSAPGDETAFNERNKNRAMYGDRWNTKGGIGRPGIMRETIGANAMSAALKNQTEQGKILSDAQEKQKDRDNALKIAKIKAKGDDMGIMMDNYGTPPLSGSGAPRTMPDQTAGGTQVPPSVPGNPAVPNQQIATQQQSAPLNNDGITVPGIGKYGIDPKGNITRPEGAPARNGGRPPDTYIRDMNEYNQNVNRMRGSWLPEKGDSKAHWSVQGNEDIIERYRRDMEKQWGPDFENRKWDTINKGAPAASVPLSQPSLPSRMDSGMMDGYPSSPVIAQEASQKKRRAMSSPVTATTDFPGARGSTAVGGQPRDAATEAMKPIYRAGEGQAETLKAIVDFMTGRKKRAKGWAGSLGDLLEKVNNP